MVVEIRLLGALEASVDGTLAELGPAQQRTVLALLALSVGTVVPLDAIVDVLWPTAPPMSATKTVQTYVSRLRKVLGDDAIERRGRGYRLSNDVVVDSREFERHLELNRRAEALALWRGPALVDVEGLRNDAAQLDELRLQTIEAGADDAVREGAAPRAIPALQRLVADYPLRESLVGRLMTALYAAGRQAEALDVYRSARARLVDELGLEPGTELRALERRILAQDPTLVPANGGPPPSTPQRRVGRTRIGLALGVAVAMAAIAATAVLATRGSTSRHRVVIRPDEILRIDPRTNRVVDAIPVGAAPSALLVRGRYAWVANEADRTLMRVDLRTGKQHAIGGVLGVGFLVQDGAGNIYSSGWDFPWVWRVGHATQEVNGRFRVRSRAVGLAVGGGLLFVVDRLANGVTSFELTPPYRRRFIATGSDPLVETFGSGALWVANSDNATVSVIRPGLSLPHTIDVGPKPYGIASGYGAIWVGSNADATIQRIDPDTLRVVKKISLFQHGLNPGLFSVAVGAGSVWGMNVDASNVSRIDPRTNKVVATIQLPPTVYPRVLAADGDQVWVSVTAPGEGP